MITVGRDHWIERRILDLCLLTSRPHLHGLVSLPIEVLSQTLLVCGGDLADRAPQPLQPLLSAHHLLLVTPAGQVTLQLLPRAARHQTYLTSKLSFSCPTTHLHLPLVLLPSHVIILTQLGGERASTTLLRPSFLTLFDIFILLNNKLPGLNISTGRESAARIGDCGGGGSA